MYQTGINDSTINSTNIFDNYSHNNTNNSFNNNGLQDTLLNS